MPKVLIVHTECYALSRNHRSNRIMAGESAEFVDELQKAGVDYDFVSPKGGFVPLDLRMKYTDESILTIYEQPDYATGLVATLPSDINPADYAAIYYTGGHGVMWDFPDNPELQTIARKFIITVAILRPFVTDRGFTTH